MGVMLNLRGIAGLLLLLMFSQGRTVLIDSAFTNVDTNISKSSNVVKGIGKLVKYSLTTLKTSTSNPS